MPGGRPRKYFTEEEERQGRLQAKKAYRERNIDEERRKSRIRTKHATIKAERAARKPAVLLELPTNKVVQLRS
ncbi:hypothetical protein M422DRAFT_276015 [Sphaerobolus stellatus SS14]|uniref:Uncharacterized protein n=1 Tax=Sphaerobolus stellatus (strain SS14) TaxID=990650 RepID=A0A0C9T3H0_SPHS4|nr:hypothetical protein M422DRAFT_276015 [Sphaerobolus stellatus SS14]